MGWIILLVVLACIAVETLVGLKRGIVLSGIRFGFTAIGTLVAALVAKAITAKIIFAIAKSQGVTGSNLATVGKELLDKLVTQVQLGSALGPHVAGIAMSTAVPFVFVILFLIFKLLTLFLYLILKAVLKKPLKVSEPKPIWSKASGAFFSGLVGLICCAIVLAPIHGVFRQIDESGAVNDLCGILETKAGLSASVTKSIKKATNNIAKTPSVYLFRFTGTEALSNAFVNRLSTITPNDIGSMGTSTKYELQNTLREGLKLVKPVDKAMGVIESKDFLKKENLETINELIGVILDTKLLADSDKVALIKAIQPTLDKTVKSAVGQSDDAPSILGDFSDIKALKENINKTMDVVVSLADLADSVKKSSADPGAPADPDDPLGLKSLDVEAILDQPEQIDKLVANVFKLDAGPDTIASLINSTVASSTGDSIANVTSAEMIKAAGEETVREAVDALLPLADLIKSGTYTADDVEKIDDKIDELAKLNLITSENQAALKDYFKPNK